MNARVAKACEIEQRAQLALARSPIYDLRVLRVERCDGGLLVSGNVSSFYHKQLAQELIRALAEGLPVINAVEVLLGPVAANEVLATRD